MKSFFLLLLILAVGLCFAYDLPAGVPTEIFGLMITTDTDLDIRHDIDIYHPAITALPHYEYLIEPIVIALEGSGLVDIVVGQNMNYTFSCAYYGASWHKAEPYAELPYDDMLLNQVDFEAGSEVILLVCRNDPFMQAVIESFTAVYDETEPSKVTVSWVTSSETGISCFRLFSGYSSDQDQVEYIYEVPATNTNQPHSYSFDVQNPRLGYTHYFWLQVMDHLCQGYRYGPVSVEVGPPYIPSNNVPYVVPNPCDNEFWCVYELRDSTLVSIVLLDCYNKVVKEICHKQSMTVGGHMQRVLVFDLPEGLYRIYYWLEQEGGPFYAYGDVLIDRGKGH